ncbi:restriction endonuclease subunit S [Staphylococcus haemolyticus]|uniref:restriction endonuclease subunit S n=1 Tax=Staphylococcus haemolyticus TaxID=1283 RepID=UPI002AD291CF|nr:restriction endonuclease subunit S [Staphylococcus haemolyticus]
MTEQQNTPELRFKSFNDEWSLSTIGALGDFYYGKSAPKWSITEDVGIPCIRYGELYTKFNNVVNEIYSYTSMPKEKLRFSKGGEILIPRVGEDPLDFAKCVYLPQKDIAIGEMISVYNTKENPLFLTYYFNTKMKYEFAKRVEGASVSNLYYSYLEDIKLKIPDIREQEKLGQFFSKLDRQIELEEEKLELLEQQKKGYIQKIFSQELRFKDGSGNEYPEWEEKTIKDVYKVTRGYVLARKLMSDNPNSINKYPVYSSQTSNNGLMGYYSDYLYQDAITWTTDGANAGSVSFRQGKFYCTNVCGVLLNELGNSNVCMAEMLNSIAFKYVSKVGNPKLMNNVMAMIKLKFPCLEEQQAISKFLNVFSEVIDNQNKKVELLKERKKGFLQKMFV